MTHSPISQPSPINARAATSISGTFAVERAPLPKSASSFPALRLTESKDYVTVQAVVPGFAEGDLAITLAKDVLCISGKQHSEIPGGFVVRHHGRRTADFRSEIKLLNQVAWDDTEAHLDLGVLTIRLRKDTPSSRPPIPIRLI